MHYLSGLIGVVFVVLALLFWQTPWIGAFLLLCGALAFVAIRPSRVSWWLYTCCIASALSAATLFAIFFFQVETTSGVAESNQFNIALLTVFVGGSAMMYIVSEYCCWLKGREDVVKVKVQFRRWRERFRIFAVSRSQ
ncbi:MAG: hypothetical protein F4Z01_03830 [Gammaproteobacteria bacterium]|nr:hypothetical protein [Gammaproteobacteria bacterium]MYF38521.1 hypothetical protein [Gammaproteobacteria bacterium]